MAPSRLLPLLAVPALLAGAAAAQTTHDVAVADFAFTPSDLVVDVGDTVRWTNLGGFHNVTSGTGGIADGIFSSGAPDPAAWTFTVTFDQAFLDANPKPGFEYGYFCEPHVTFGMEAKVTVQIPPAIAPIGCGVNPAGSLVTLSGQPQVGTTWTPGVDDPTASLPPGSLAFLFGTVFPDPAFPCGTPIPGFGMVPGAPGELLLQLAPPPVVSVGPVAWAGSGTPAPLPVPLPPLPAAVGLDLVFQGALLEPVAFDVGLSEGLLVTIGS